MFELPFSVFMLSEGPCGDAFSGDIVRSIESVFFCGWGLSVVVLVCLVAGAVWRRGVSVAVSCLMLLLDSCSVICLPSPYSCSGFFFRSPSCFVSCSWVVDVVVLPPRWYCLSNSCCTRSKAAWCSTKSSQIPVFLRKSELFAIFVKMKSI